MAKEVDGWFERILTLLHQQTGVDFAQYKQATLRRRLERRMQARKTPSFREYFRYLRAHPDETMELFQDVLIPVTSFFRDSAVFNALKTGYFPRSLRQKPVGGP